MIRRALVLPLLAVTLLPACRPAEAQEDGFRVAVARFQHETCTFCPGGDTDVEAWTRHRGPIEGEEVLRADSYVEGFADRSREYGDVELVGLRSPYEVYGGSSRSWNTEEAFDHFADMIVEDLRAEMPVDGVYLALHGAMAVRNVPRPEAELARRVREAVGPDVPIVATFDLHGNEDGRFLRWADGAFTTKRYPHYDAYRQGERAARFLREVMRGAYEPTTATRKPPVVTATVLQWTGQSPSMDIMERARRWEAREDDAFVSVFYGYPWSDVPDVGTTVHVMTDGDRALADTIAADMADFIWRVRERFAHGDYPGPERAVAMARDSIAAGATPVVLADYSDRPGDATWILRELKEQRVGRVIYGALRDERALRALAERGAEPGDAFSRRVGGFTGRSAGEPVLVEGTVRYFGPAFGYDTVAAVGYGNGNVLFLTPAYEQIIRPETLAVGGIDPDRYDVFVLKSRVHFRRGFDETGYAETMIITDAPGPFVGTTRLDALHYRHLPLDRLYPFGDPGDWRGRSTNPGVSAP